MILEEITGKSIQELYHKDKLPKPEKASIFTLNDQPSTVPFCSKGELNQSHLRIIDVADYFYSLSLENEELRKIEYDGKVKELWPID